MSKDGIQIRRIFLEKEAIKIKELQENAPEFMKHYPKHNDWLKFAIKEVIEGRRYAFGIYRSYFSGVLSDPKVELIGSIILKREIYTNSFELKNLFVKNDFRKQGFGADLLEVVEQFCTKRGGIQIETEVPSIERNTVNFLSKKEFFVQEHIESLFKERDRIYRMVKKLYPKYTGDPFDLENIGTWTFENIYNFKLTKKQKNCFEYEVPFKNDKKTESEISITGICHIYDEINTPNLDELKNKFENKNHNLFSVISRNSSDSLKKFCHERNIFVLDFSQIKKHFKKFFFTEFQDFSKEDIGGMIVPINFKYFKSFIDSTYQLTYFKGGPTGKFLKEGDLVLMYIEDSQEEPSGGIKAYAEIRETQISSPDEIWNTYKEQNPIFPESDFMTWSVDKSEVVAFKIKNLKFIEALDVTEVTSEKEITPFDNEKLGQFYLDKQRIHSFLLKRKEIDPSSFDKSSAPKIFLSSTIEDLKPERAEITNLITAGLSYNIFVSEYAGSFPTPRDTIISELQNSDVYICIVGAKYGYELEVDGRKISATHDEFLNARKESKEILVYVKNVTDRESKAIAFIKEIGDYAEGYKYQNFSNNQDLLKFIKKDLAKMFKPKN